MMDQADFLKWAVAFGFAVFSAIGGWLIAAFNKHSTRINEVHARINVVRDTYVRRDDFDGRLSHIERGVDAVRDEVKALNGLLLDRLPAKR